MAQVLQDVGGMAIDFERSCGYSLPTFKVQYVSSTNSSSSYRSNKPTTKNRSMEPVLIGCPDYDNEVIIIVIIMTKR